MTDPDPTGGASASPSSPAPAGNSAVPGQVSTNPPAAAPSALPQTGLPASAQAAPGTVTPAASSMAPAVATPAPSAGKSPAVLKPTEGGAAAVANDAAANVAKPSAKPAPAGPEHPAADVSAPSRIIVRYGMMHNIGEFRHNLETLPAPGTKVVIRTERGVELGEVVISLSDEPGCHRCISTAKLGEFLSTCGPEYPYRREGKILRVANHQDIIDSRHLETSAREETTYCRQQIREMKLDMRLVCVEHLLGGERIIFCFSAENRVDFRELVRRLASQFRTRIEMRQVGARDEARLVGDYERCGQRCCCQQYLKDLKPVSMRMAKVQKATLDPSKISGRCGRLMCCLRYEDATYEDLRKLLPRRNTWVKTAKHVGKVIDGHVLTQFVRLLLADNTQVVVSSEEILERDVPAQTIAPPPPPREAPPPRPRRKLGAEFEPAAPQAAPRDGAAEGPAETARDEGAHDAVDAAQAATTDGPDGPAEVDEASAAPRPIDQSPQAADGAGDRGETSRDVPSGAMAGAAGGNGPEGGNGAGAGRRNEGGGNGRQRGGRGRNRNRDRGGNRPPRQGPREPRQGSPGVSGEARPQSRPGQEGAAGPSEGGGSAPPAPTGQGQPSQGQRPQGQGGEQGRRRRRRRRGRGGNGGGQGGQGGSGGDRPGGNGGDSSPAGG